MASRSSSRSHPIDKLDFDANRRRASSSHGSEHTGLLASDESFFSNIVEGAVSLDRRKMARNITRYISFASAILNCLCAGSISAYSLYGTLFISHLKYSQYQVNAITTAAGVGLYVTVPFFGYLCDRYSPRSLSLAAAIFFGGGYLLAALTYRAGPLSSSTRDVSNDTGGWPFTVMILAFTGVGAGTCSMYLSAVTTCAKNFGRGEHKGLALAMPITAYGLSGIWFSQVGSHFFKERDHPEDTDLYHYFLFLAGLLFAVSIIGTLGLKVVDEEDLIDEAVSEMERSGLLEESDCFHHSLHDSSTTNNHIHTNGYGTLSPTHPKPASLHSHPSALAQRKTLLLNASTRLFLSDPTMWLLTFGFFLTIGPGETYINNVGTLLHTLYPPSSSPLPNYNTPTTHVSTIALTSTIARLATGTLSDLLAPSSPPSNKRKRKYSISRLLWLIFSTLLFSAAQLLLATPLPHSHDQLFPVISALVGIGYGAIFSLIPIIISTVWSVENFGTNWGIVAVFPAAGAAMWGAVYSWVYQHGIRGSGGGIGGSTGAGAGRELGTVEQQDKQCYGSQCYRTTFLCMAVASWVAIALWTWVWRSWRRRGIAV